MPKVKTNKTQIVCEFRRESNGPCRTEEAAVYENPMPSIEVAEKQFEAWAASPEKGLVAMRMERIPADDDEEFETLREWKAK